MIDESYGKIVQPPGNVQHRTANGRPAHEPGAGAPDPPPPVSAHAASVDLLHLAPPVRRALTRAGITTLGTLHARAGADVHAAGMAKDELWQNVRACFAAMHAASTGCEVDWPRYWRARGVTLLPDGPAPATPAGTLAGLGDLIRAVVVREVDDRAAQIVQRRFGLLGASRRTLEELGSAFSISRERVRQIESTALARLKRRVVDVDFADCTYRIEPNAARTVGQIYTCLEEAVADGLLESVAVERVGALCGVATTVARAALPVIELFLVLAGAERVSFDYPGLEPAWVGGTRAARSRIKTRVRRLHTLLTAGTPTSLDDVDLLLHLNRASPKSDHVTPAVLSRLVALCSSVERTADGRVRGRFEHLSVRAHQVERLLLEAGRPTRRTALARELNHRLGLHGPRAVTGDGISGSLSPDDRFVALGKSGYWALAAWPDVAGGGMASIMEEYLTRRNVPATVDALHAHAEQRRGLPLLRSSVLTILTLDPRFARAGHNLWGLRAWGTSTDAANWNARHIAEFVAEQFAKHGAPAELEFRVVRAALADAAGIGQRQASALLQRSPAIGVRRGEGSRRYATFRPGYEDALWVRRERRAWKTATLREQVAGTVRELLMAAPARELPLAEVMTALASRFKRPRATLYTYIAALDFVERLTAAGTRRRVCRLKPQPADVQYPLVAKVVDPRIRANVTRATALLNVETVDVGLFLLGKEFEDVLKAALVTALGRGSLTPAPAAKPEKWRLVDMVDYARQAGFITSKAELHVLREQRNERAHGATPSLGEREALLRSAPLLANMYIGYINLFDGFRRRDAAGA